MITQIILAVLMLAALFILFLVISKATGGIDNSLYKLEYLVRKECDNRLEVLEMKYKIKQADRKFDEFYSTKHIADSIQKATDSNE
ncbi:MAG: hypothetical protein LBU70_07565 [Chitinispirillales bacterium]|jgi:hypothetical protein|nr:hypothetical protein [Chitinispirillales bacterium]